MDNILIPKVITVICFVMWFMSFAIGIFMKMLWPQRFASLDGKMSTQNPSDLMIWISIPFWLAMFCFRTMFSSW